MQWTDCATEDTLLLIQVLIRFHKSLRNPPFYDNAELTPVLF